MLSTSTAHCMRDGKIRGKTVTFGSQERRMRRRTGTLTRPGKCRLGKCIRASRTSPASRRRYIARSKIRSAHWPLSTPRTCDQYPAAQNGVQEGHHRVLGTRTQSLAPLPLPVTLRCTLRQTHEPLTNNMCRSTQSSPLVFMRRSTGYSLSTPSARPVFP